MPDELTRDAASVSQHGRPRLLIVDDSSIMRNAIARILGDEYELLLAENGEHAWEVLSKQPLTAVITERDLPDLDCYGLVERIRGAPDAAIKHLPVVVVVSEEDIEAERRKAVKLGANQLIAKPFDSSELRQHARTLVELAHRPVVSEGDEVHMLDPLTALPNRAYFLFRGDKDLSFSKRHGKELSVLLVQMDNLEELVREHGRPVAKQLLKKLASYIKVMVRMEDTVARVGVRRFAVISPMTNEFGAKEMADRILKRVRQTVFRHGGGKISFRVSMGLASPRLQTVKNFEALVDIARQRLEMAVLAGGNQLVFGDLRPAAVPTAEPDPDPDPPVDIDTAGDTGLHTMIRPALSIPGPEQALPIMEEPATKPAGPAPALEVAMWLLENGQTDKIKPHLGKLLQEVLPLLDNADQTLGLEVQDAIAKIREHIVNS